MAEPVDQHYLEADSDDDSSLGNDELEASVASISESVKRYQLENGRTYHSMSAGKYAFPNDEAEKDRLDCQNHHFLVTFQGKTEFSPGAETAQRVLDCGTGTGIWAIDFADAHPGAEVVGVDLSPIQPPFVPPNLVFELDDLEKDWTWNRPFDYIFSRMLVGSIADFPKFTSQAFNNLTPGGYLEMIDSVQTLGCDDGTLTGTALEKWNNLIIKASENFGRSLAESANHKQRLIDAGFVDVVEKYFKWPTNSWPKDKHLKEVGLWTLSNIDVGLEGLSMALMTRGLGMSKEEVFACLPEFRQGLRNRKIHAYWPIVVVYGRKPLNAPPKSESPEAGPIKADEEVKPVEPLTK